MAVEDASPVIIAIRTALKSAPISCARIRIRRTKPATPHSTVARCRTIAANASSRLRWTGKTVSARPVWVLITAAPTAATSSGARA